MSTATFPSEEAEHPATGAPASRAAHAITLGAFETILSGRGLAIAGLLSFLVGTAYFLELSFQRGWIGPMQRIVIGIAVGSFVLGASTRFLRGAYRTIAEGTAGLGAGIVYLSSWAAIALFPDLHVPHVAVFGAMVAVTAVLAIAADRARAQALALFGLAGAYLTPLLLASVHPEREALAVYLLIVTTGLLLLARRRRFAVLEVATTIATLPYALAFVPSVIEGWTNVDAAVVASTFFAVFAAAFTMRPLGQITARVRAVPLIALTALYASSIEAIFATSRTLLETTLATVAIALVAITRTTLVPRDMTVAYRFLGLFVANLALRAFLNGTSLYDALAVEAALLVAFGVRTSVVAVARLGVALSAVAAIGLLWETLTLDFAHAWLTPLACGFAVWARSAYTVRRAIPEQYAGIASGVGHAVAFVGITRFVLDGFGLDYSLATNWYGLSSVALVTLSIAWAAFAALLFGRGIATRSAMLRWEGLSLFALTIVKVFTIDATSLDIIFRVAAFMVTGAIFVASSAWYTHATHHRLVRAEPS